MSDIGKASTGTLGAALVLIAAGAAWATGTIGGFDASRAGSQAIATGAAFSDLRAAISGGLPGVTFSEAPALTPAYLAGVNVLILCAASGSTSAITPLSAAEQSALRDFVLQGHAAILLVDNDTFGGANSSPANQSLIAPFGCHVTGTGAGWPVPISTTPTFPITSGVAGTVPMYTVGWSGWLDQLGPGFVSVATEPESGLPALALLPRGGLGPCGGAVLVSSDSTLMFNGFIGTPESTLVLNMLWYVNPPCECFANCDGSTTPPILNVNDFICFQSRFAAGDTYANCDHSTSPPVLNVNDFVCYQAAFAAGCR